VAIVQRQELGKNRPAAAKRSTIFGLAVLLVIVGLLGVAVALLPAQLAQIFSSDPIIIDFFIQIRFPLAAVMVRMHTQTGRDILLVFILTSLTVVTAGFDEL